MAGMGSYGQPIDAGQLIRGMQKRTAYEERRPLIRTASDLLGPGFGSKAVRTLDWNADELAFNGFFYSEPGAQNGPDGNRYWMGIVEATDVGHGYQRVLEYRNEDNPLAPPVEWVRLFSSAGGSRTYGTWLRVGTGTIRNVGSVQVIAAVGPVAAITNVATVTIPFPVNGTRYRATYQSEVLNDTAGAFTDSHLKWGVSATTGGSPVGYGLSDHRVANRRQAITVVGEFTYVGTTGAANVNVVATITPGSSNSSTFANSNAPILLTVDEIVP